MQASPVVGFAHTVVLGGLRMRVLVACCALVVSAGCDPAAMFPDADEKFGRQNFNSAIALIELHKVRNGIYPESLSELEHLGEWDQLWLAAVEYTRTDNGYNLFVKRGWMQEPELSYPPSFREGLGLEESNIKWEEP